MNSRVPEVSMEQAKSKALRVISIGGLVAGTLDITAACVTSWIRTNTGPVRVCQSVASGLLGPSAYDGGMITALLGLLIHFFIATTWTTVFYLASRRLRILVERPVTMGLLYGVIVYAFMNFVVIPLSAIPPRATPMPTSGRLIGLSIIMVCIGLPIAVITSRLTGDEARPV